MGNFWRRVPVSLGSHSSPCQCGSECVPHGKLGVRRNDDKQWWHARRRTCNDGTCIVISDRSMIGRMSSMNTSTPKCTLLYIVCTVIGICDAIFVVWCMNETSWVDRQCWQKLLPSSLSTKPIRCDQKENQLKKGWLKGDSIFHIINNVIPISDFFCRAVTWILSAVWLGLGALLYFCYGMHHSNLNPNRSKRRGHAGDGQQQMGLKWTN